MVPQTHTYIYATYIYRPSIYFIWFPHKNDIWFMFTPVVCRRVYALSLFCMFAYNDVQHFVLSYVYMFWATCCNVRYDPCMVTMLASNFPPGIMSYLRYVCFLAHIGVQLILTMWETCRVSYKRQELLSIRGRLGSLPDFDGIRAAYRFRLLCCWFFCFAMFVFILCLGYPMLSVSLDCPFLISP